MGYWRSVFFMTQNFQVGVKFTLVLIERNLYLKILKALSGDISASSKVKKL